MDLSGRPPRLAEEEPRAAPSVAAGLAEPDGIDPTWLPELLAVVRTHHAAVPLVPIERAFEVARAAHRDQRRHSGEPYFVHPYRVARTIAELGLDSAAVIAGLLHDAVEDSDLSLFDVTEQFGREIAGMVDGVTKLGKIPYLSRQEQQAESFRKMLLAMSQDIRVLLVKLADRLDNMRTLGAMPVDKRERIAKETMEIYAPLAHRLGIETWRRELQDLSFRNLQPMAWAEIRDRIDDLIRRHPTFVDDTIRTLSAAFSGETCALGPETLRWPFAELGMPQVLAAMRTPYNLWSLQSGDGEIEHAVDQVADLANYQVVTPDRASCYVALGVLHAFFQPVPGRFRDYVALPRPNQYRALHTTLIDRSGTRMEVQIRSRAMHAVAEHGIVADVREGGGGGDRKLAWLTSLMDFQRQVSDPSEFIEAVKADLFADEVYVFTPQGDIHTFPRGATPIDFAFAIHTDVGMACSGARVNGHPVSLRYQMHQGDTVEILTAEGAAPRKEWLDMCVTPRARARIKHDLRQRERSRQREVGRSLLSQALAARGVDLGELERGGVVGEQVERLGLGREARDTTVYQAVGSGRVGVGSVVELLAPERPSLVSTPANLISRVLRKVAGRASDRGAARVVEGNRSTPIVITLDRVRGGGAALIKLAGCCLPVPGDPIAGFFAPDEGIVVHVQGCPRALSEVAGERVYLAWPPELRLEVPVKLSIRTSNDVGLLARMSRVFSRHGVNIKQAYCRTDVDQRRAQNVFHATIHTRAELDSLIAALKAIPGVGAVERVFPIQGGPEGPEGAEGPYVGDGGGEG